MSNDRLTDTS